VKPPNCKLCGKAHWTYEDHHTGNSAINPEYIREMASGAMGKVMPADSARGIPSSEVQPGGMGRNFRMSPPVVPTDADCPHVIPAEKLIPQCACGKPRDGRHSSCAACRKRAYRGSRQ
jgi:hypothetical protein